MKDLRITLVQGATHWHDPVGNREYYGGLISGLQGNTDLVLLPETFTSGFSNDAIAQAETMDGPTVVWIREQACALGAAICGSVQLRDIGTPVTNLGAMTCPLGYAFTLWVQSDLQVPAMGEFGSPVVRLETFGTYSCRNINGAATGQLSQHATSNAVDVAAFVLKDGRRISVLGGWTGTGLDGERAGRFLHTVRNSACRRFNIVLSPDYNAAHRDHMHFDMGRGPLCR